MVYGRLVATIGSLILLDSLAWCAEPTSAPSSIGVHLVDGRTLSGTVHARSNQDRLWLVIGTPTIALFKPVRWEEIASIETDDVEFSASEFREQIQRRQPRVHIESLAALTAKRVDAVREAPPHSAPRRIESLKIEARLANWDDDVNADGLELRIMPSDGSPGAIPVNGMLNVQLTGQVVRLAGWRGVFRTLGQWTHRVRREDFDYLGAVYRLPFRNVNPQFDRDIAATVLVNARLGVPGQRDFEASNTARVRQFNPIREQLWIQQRTRFFPFERTRR